MNMRNEYIFNNRKERRRRKIMKHEVLDQIRFVPEIKSLLVRGIGVWEVLEMKFGPGLNLITGKGGTGKTTILKAIVAAFDGLIHERYLSRHEESEIQVTPQNSGIFIKPLTEEFFVYPLNYDSMSDRLRKVLARVISGSSGGLAILLDSEVLDRMDDEDYVLSIENLKNSKRQVIAVSARTNCAPESKVFECLCDPNTDRYIINQQQARERGLNGE